MVSKGISQQCQRRYPKFKDGWLQNKVMRYALAYLVCFQIMVNHFHIALCQQLIDCGIRDVAKLSGKGVSTVQRVKRLMKVQSSQ